MRAPNFSQADYLAAMQALMPRGRVWPRDATAVQTMVLNGLAASYARQTERSNNLLVDAFPTSTVELLPEWESTLGLPCPEIGPAPSIAARQQLVAARFVGCAGQGAAALEAYAALLGFDSTIAGNAPFRCGQSSCGQSLGTTDQMFVLKVTTPGATDTAYGEYGPAVLQYELQRVVAAYSVLNFIFP